MAHDRHLMQDTASRSHVYLHAQVLEYAERHFTDPELTLEDPAAFLGVTSRTLRSALSANMTSWSGIVIGLRMARARELLRTPKTSKYLISQIARLCGYSSESAFSKAFRAQNNGMGPAQYRRGITGLARAGGATGAFRPVRNTDAKSLVQPRRWVASTP